MNVCAVDGCGPAEKTRRGWCFKHYMQWRRTGDPTGTLRRSTAERFWSKVTQEGDCWVWVAARNAGYGRFAPDSDTRGVLAHRWAYEYMVAPIPAGLTLDHLCRNRACVNPDHLDPCPTAVNTRRGGRALRTHCPAGHEYTPENTYNTRQANGGPRRQCRTCVLAQQRAAWQRKKAMA